MKIQEQLTEALRPLIREILKEELREILKNTSSKPAATPPKPLKESVNVTKMSPIEQILQQKRLQIQSNPESAETVSNFNFISEDVTTNSHTQGITDLPFVKRAQKIQAKLKEADAL